MFMNKYYNISFSSLYIQSPSVVMVYFVVLGLLSHPVIKEKKNKKKTKEKTNLPIYCFNTCTCDVSHIHIHVVQ